MHIDLERDSALLDPIRKTSWRFYFVFSVLLLIISNAGVAYFFQLKYGLGVTGLNRPAYWGIYIINFVFFIGISHAGTLISAILRICKAEWRRSITRSAEVITVMVISFGVASILMDLGRPDRMLNLFKYGRFQSPLLWDVCSISIYFVGSAIYLYLPLIPDIAILRDNLGKYNWLYKPLALGWTGTEKQHKLLEKLIGIMALIVLPIAVSVHTVVSFVFVMTVQPMWHTAIFGPFFVCGAIYSGIAALIVALALLRWVYHLESYFKPVHFNNLGMLLIVMCCLWSYFVFSEFLTTFYGDEPSHMVIFYDKMDGRFSLPFWGMILCCFVIPFTILVRKKTRTITGTVIASIFINIGMYLERYIIVVPTLANPRLPIPRGNYAATWVEISLLAGCAAGFILFYLLFTKFFPIVSIWEIQEGRNVAIKGASKRIQETLPSN